MREEILLLGEKRFHFDNRYFDNPKEYDSILLYQIGDICSESKGNCSQA